METSTMYQLHRWEAQPNIHYTPVGGWDPQYYFQHGASTLGLRFQLSGSETLDSTYQIICKLTIGAVALHWGSILLLLGFEHYYIEEEVTKDVDFVTYRYELPIMSSIVGTDTHLCTCWRGFGVQMIFGLPFRSMVSETWGVDLVMHGLCHQNSISALLHIGYQYSQ